MLIPREMNDPSCFPPLCYGLFMVWIILLMLILSPNWVTQIDSQLSNCSHEGLHSLRLYIMHHYQQRDVCVNTQVIKLFLVLWGNNFSWDLIWLRLEHNNQFILLSSSQLVYSRYIFTGYNDDSKFLVPPR